MTSDSTEDLLRQLAPQVLGALVRRFGHFDTAEDAVQEALLAASQQWPRQGLPDNPKSWLISVGSRRFTDLLRSEQARQRRQNAVVARTLPEDYLSPAADFDRVADHDDSLILLFLCCHPQLSPQSQIALTLRAVGGLTTAEIAKAFLVPEATMAQRISRAKAHIKDSGVPFALPKKAEAAERLDAVLRVIYLIFNEGYAATSGPYLFRADLSGEAIRLGRMLCDSMPNNGAVLGLLALMLLTDARRPARIDESGELVPLADQDRGLWRADFINEGVTLASAAFQRQPIGSYQLLAAIAAVHDRAPNEAATDWPEIVRLYELMLRVSDNPITRLNLAVAVAMASGPQSGLDLLDELDADRRLQRHHRFHAARAHLLERTGDSDGAVAAYELAARLAGSIAEKRYLNRQAARLASLQ